MSRRKKGNKYWLGAKMISVICLLAVTMAAFPRMALAEWIGINNPVVLFNYVLNDTGATVSMNAKGDYDLFIGSSNGYNIIYYHKQNVSFTNSISTNFLCQYRDEDDERYFITVRYTSYTYPIYSNGKKYILGYSDKIHNPIQLIVLSSTLNITKTLYPVWMLNLTVLNDDGSPYNGTVIVGERGPIGEKRSSVTISDGVGAIEVGEGSKISVWSGTTTRINYYTYDDRYQQIYTDIPGTVPAGDYEATVKSVTAMYSESFSIISNDIVTETGIEGSIYSTTDRWGSAYSETTDLYGTAKFDFIFPVTTETITKPNDYLFTEVSLPKGYKKSGTGFILSSTGPAITTKTTNTGSNHSVTQEVINPFSTSKTLTYTYDPTMDYSSLYLTLEDDETGEPIKSGRFDVMIGSTVLKSLTTNSNGEAVYTNISNGTYTIKQIATDSNYNINTTTQTVTVNRDDTYITVKNVKKKGDLTVKIIDSATGDPITGARFILNGNGSNKTITTNSSGILPLSNISYGTYTLNEYEMPGGYIAKNLSLSLTLNTSTSGSEYVYSYNRTTDTSPPAISFSAQPAENTQDSFSQIITMNDNSSGIRELKIDGVSVLMIDAPGTLNTTYTHLITDNKTYSYTLTDYAGNTYTTTQTVKCIKYKPVGISQPVMTNYKTTVTYNGGETYVVNSSYAFSNISFEISGDEAGNTFSYKIELMDSESGVLQQISKTTSKLGSVTERLLYQDSNTGAAAVDGVYTVIVTVTDKFSSATESMQVIVKRIMPPKPVITYSSLTGIVNIEYPTDFFDTYSTKQYSYTDGTKTYVDGFAVTKSGTVTAAYTDIAGNKSTALLLVNPPRTNEDGTIKEPIVIPTSTPGSSESMLSFGNAIEETKNCIIYFVNIKGYGNDPSVTNAILKLIE